MTELEDNYLERCKKLYAALDKKEYAAVKSELDSKEDSFVQFMDTYILENGLVRQSIMRRADIAVSYGYKLLSGEKHTKNRNVILRLCIAMNMKIDDIQNALSLYGMNGLNEGSRDSIITTGVLYRKTIDEIDDWLITLDLEPLMDSYDR